MVEQQALAFRPEHYENAQRNQIKDDVISYLGEYRFEVSEFQYKLGIVRDKLVDPNSKESMTSKAGKAIVDRQKTGLQITREKAELEGLYSLENQLKENKTGTVIWFSPPGEKEDGYGDYGFAYTGKVEGDELKMTAIRLERPASQDFNLIANAMWGERNERSTEDFLRMPKVIDVSEDKAKEFIHGVFEVKTEESKQVFEKALEKMSGVINDSTLVLRYGTPEEKRKTMAVLENMSIELRHRLTTPEDDKVISLSDYQQKSLSEAIVLPQYIKTPPAIAGSCGMSGKIESSNFLGNLLSSPNNSLNKDNQEWFTCPKCTYKADGPVGDQCPGCGLTKDQYVEEGGANCE